MAATLINIALMPNSSIALYSCRCGWCHMYDRETKLSRAQTCGPHLKFTAQRSNLHEQHQLHNIANDPLRKN